MEYITGKEVALKLDISERRVQWLCEHSGIEGMLRLGKAWAIPKQATKPADARKTNVNK